MLLLPPWPDYWWFYVPAIALGSGAAFFLIAMACNTVMLGGPILLRNDDSIGDLKRWQAILLFPLSPGIAAITLITFGVVACRAGLHLILFRMPRWILLAIPRIPAAIRNAPSAIRSWLKEDIDI